MSLTQRNIFETAVNITSTRLKLMLLQISDENIPSIQEIRLRAEKPVVIVNDKGSMFLSDKCKLTRIYTDSCIKSSAQEISDTVNRACNYSIHSYQNNINKGFITVSGGHRVGLTGTAVSINNEDFNVRDITSVNIRIARQVFGVSQKVTDLLFRNSVESIIVAGSPSSGKTTFLKDLAYRLSSGITGDYIKMTVLDERGELSAPFNGVSQNDLGLNTDVLVNYKKSDAVELSLRSMSPEYIIFDEICTDEDVRAIKLGINSGVKFAVSIHCGNENDLKEKELLKELIRTKSFPYVVLLSKEHEPCTVKKIFNPRVINDEIIWNSIDFNMLCNDGLQNQV